MIPLLRNADHKKIELVGIPVRAPFRIKEVTVADACIHFQYSEQPEVKTQFDAGR